MRKCLGVGKPRCLQGQSAALWAPPLFELLRSERAGWRKRFEREASIHQGTEDRPQVLEARDLVVNRFEDIYCAGEGLAEHAVHFWKRSRGTLVENNIIVDCARGMGFGMGDTDTGSRIYADAPNGSDFGHIDGIIRNNVIYADIDYFDTGIEIIQARQPVVVHNTVVSWGARAFSAPSTTVLVAPRR